MKKYIYIKINKHVLSKCLYVKNNENDKNKGNINNNFYIINLNNNNREKEDKTGLKNILNSFLIKITVYKPVLIHYIKLY